MKLLVFAKQSPLKTDGSMKSTGLDVGTNYDFNFSECVARLQVRVRAQPCVTVGRALYNFSIGGNIHTHTHSSRNMFTPTSLFNAYVSDCPSSNSAAAARSCNACPCSARRCYSQMKKVCPESLCVRWCFTRCKWHETNFRPSSITCRTHGPIQAASLYVRALNQTKGRRHPKGKSECVMCRVYSLTMRWRELAAA